MTFKDHFSDHANVYAAARPNYPDELFRFLSQSVRERKLAWDCATGNGQSAIGLSEYFDRVIATDGSSSQVAHAQRRSNIEYQVSLAEAPNITPQSLDLVTVAQALHWFDRDSFFAAVEKGLKPGGVLAIWSYGIHTINPAVDEVINELYRGTLNGFWTPERAMVEEGYKDIEFPYSAIEHPSFSMSLQWARPQVEEYLRSWSAVQKYIKENGTDPVAEISSSLAKAWGSAQTLTIRWPLTLVLRQKPML